MTEHATVIRYNKGLKQADEKIVELLDRFQNINLSDKTPVGQHQLRLRPPALQHAGTFARHRAGRRLRDESRGAHYKPDFPERNDENF